jgi:deazaflavin-dependent oxidoreductase (nitroreductase family)
VAYLRPPWFVRAVFNRLAMRTGASGSNTLTVAGRRSGAPSSVPVIPIELHGRRYVVSTRGESEWVRNLRAAGVAELSHKGSSTRVRASEVPVGERAAVIAEYQRIAGKMVAPYFRRLPDPADHPVFEVVPVGAA